MEGLEPPGDSIRSQQCLMQACPDLQAYGTLLSPCEVPVDSMMDDVLLELCGTVLEAPGTQQRPMGFGGAQSLEVHLLGPSTPEQEADAMCCDHSSELATSRECSQSGVFLERPGETDDEALLRHMRAQEVQADRRPDPLYFNSTQREVNPKMRAIVVDWLVEVVEEWRLSSDSLYLAVNIMDRYLSVCAVTRNELQLVGATCLWIASKYEELQPPTASDFVFMAEESFSRDALLAQEQVVLGALGFALTVATSKGFLRALLKVCGADKQLQCLASYLCELSLLDHSLLRHMPSEVASACMYLARAMLRHPGWAPSMAAAIHYTPAELGPCVLALGALHASLSSNTQLAAIRDKYAAARYRSVALVPPLPNLHAECLALMGARWAATEATHVTPFANGKASRPVVAVCGRTASETAIMACPIMVADLGAALSC